MANKSKYKTNLMLQSFLHRACSFCLCSVILGNAGFALSAAGQFQGLFVENIEMRRIGVIK
jgi:hypothetical protein